MVNTNFSVFSDPAYRPYFIGYQDLLKKITETTVSQTTKQTYPPFNVKKIDENIYLVELAVAGFDKKDIEIEIKDSILTVKSDITPPEITVGEEWIHRGIGLRNFTRQFTLADTVKVTSAEMVNGMLKIKLENIIPEDQNPIKVKIL